MKTFILIFLVCSTLTVLSQKLHLTNKSVSSDYKLNSGENDSIYYRALSFGAGPVFYNRSFKTESLLFLDYNLHVYEELYFDFGLSTITDFHNYGLTLQISPNLKFNAMKNKLSFFIGSGFFSTISVFPGVGVTFYLKTQYNFKNNISIGFVYNHSIIFGDYNNNGIFMNPCLYVSFKL